MLLIRLGAVLAAGSASVVASANPAQLRLSPDPLVDVDGDGVQRVPPLTAPQANAVLAHHLGVAQYEHMPVSNGDQTWQRLLTVQDGAASGAKVVVVLECGRAECQDLIPDEFDTSNPVDLPSLPAHSWTAAVTLHLHRLATSLGIDKQSSVVYGLDSLAHGLKSIDGWAGWVGDELGSRIGWDKIKDTFKAAVEPIRNNFGMLTDVDMLDESGRELVMELEQMASLTDRLNTAQNDDGPQSSSFEIVALHIKGINKVAEAHARDSETYQQAVKMLRQSLSATLASLRQSAATRDADQPTFVLLTLPSYKAPLLQRRANWLQPFQAASASYAKVARPRLARSMSHAKRSTVFSPRAEAADRTPQPIVPQSRTCFASEKELKNLTASCLGRGQAVKGITSKNLEKGDECWVCACGQTTDDSGKVHRWSGEGCEKEDLSGDFVLLFFSGLGLVVILVASVYLLYGVGNVELPGTLSSVSGAGTGQKRD